TRPRCPERPASGKRVSGRRGSDWRVHRQERPPPRCAKQGLWRATLRGDMVMPHMLHMQVLRSPHAHARIVSIDTSGAEAMPGVEGVITCADVPGEDGFGVFVHDQPVLARGKVRYVGDAVAAVAAESPLIAR